MKFNKYPRITTSFDMITVIVDYFYFYFVFSFSLMLLLLSFSIKNHVSFLYLSNRSSVIVIQEILGRTFTCLIKRNLFNLNLLDYANIKCK